MAIEKRWYGCEEVTIGFRGNGHGNEICDYILMDSKGTIRCYEIKITLPDLKSNAKKSWYGHYNYLVISSDLFGKTGGFDIPEDVGIIVGSSSQREGNPWKLETIVKPKKRMLTIEDEIFITQSMVRTMMYKIMKYKDSKSLEKMKGIERDSRYWEREYKKQVAEYNRLYMIIRKMEYHIRKTTCIRVKLEDVAEVVGWK